MEKRDKHLKGKEQRAIALQYDPAANTAPVITAVGQGVVAENIIEAATDSGVPIVQDESVADVLSHFSVGSEIPPALYEAVAQILIFISDMAAKR